MSVIIIDTDILIDSGRDDQTAIGCLNRLETQSILAISIVTHMELLVGCRNQEERKKLESFLRRYQVIKLTPQISDKAVELLNQYRLSHGLLIADALIAATAIESGEPLITKNQRDFRFIAELNLLSYP